MKYILEYYSNPIDYQPRPGICSWRPFHGYSKAPLPHAPGYSNRRELQINVSRKKKPTPISSPSLPSKAPGTVRKPR